MSLPPPRFHQKLDPPCRGSRSHHKREVTASALVTGCLLLCKFRTRSDSSSKCSQTSLTSLFALVLSFSHCVGDLFISTVQSRIRTSKETIPIQHKKPSNNPSLYTSLVNFCLEQQHCLFGVNFFYQNLNSAQKSMKQKSKCRKRTFWE